MVEELLADSLWVLVGEQATDGKLLVDEVGHGELLTHKLRGELWGQEPAVAQEGWRSLGTEWRAGVVLAGGVRQTVGLGGGLRVPEDTLDGQSSSAAQGAQMGGGG